jgi:hypothetical protein
MRARWLADSLTARIRSIYGDSASHDLRVARGFAMAGFDLVVLGEYFCEVPVPVPGERYGPLLKPDSLFGLAMARFDSAIKVAAAAKAASAKVTSGPNLALAQRMARRRLGAELRARRESARGIEQRRQGARHRHGSAGNVDGWRDGIRISRVLQRQHRAGSVNRFQPDFSAVRA